MEKTPPTQPNYYTVLRRKIMASMMIVPFVPFLAVVIIGYYYFTTSVQHTTIAKMQRVVEDHRHMIESFLKERKADLQFIIDTYPFEAVSRPSVIEEAFGALQKGSDAFVDLGVFNEAGLHVAYRGPYELAGKVYSEAPWFREVMQTGEYISDIFLGYRNVPHFIIAVAKKEDHGAWALRATIDTLLFTNLVEKVRMGKTGEAYILNKEGAFQTRRRSGGDLLEKDPDLAHYHASPEGTKTFIEKDAHGETYLYATTPLKNNDWLLVARQERADAFRALRSATYLVILVTVIGGILIVFLASYVSARIIKRMEHLDREKSRLSHQLIMAGRLAEIGEMSAGFAHEINNPLQIIRAEQTLIETILADLEEKGALKPSSDTEEILDSLQQIKVQVDRCAKITQALLKFAREKEPVVRNIDLRSFIPETASMVARKASVEGITMVRHIPDDIPFIHGDPSELEQVMVNLINNAIDAIVLRHGSSGGRLEIKAQAVNNSVEIVVADNGCGISPEALGKIFTPFFTTKPVGKGTGLGLSVCFGIIDKMGGVIEVKSEKGEGTTFTIRLPKAAA